MRLWRLACEIDVKNGVVFIHFSLNFKIDQLNKKKKLHKLTLIVYMIIGQLKNVNLHKLHVNFREGNMIGLMFILKKMILYIYIC